MWSRSSPPKTPVGPPASRSKLAAVNGSDQDEQILTPRCFVAGQGGLDKGVRLPVYRAQIGSYALAESVPVGVANALMGGGRTEARRRHAEHIARSRRRSR